MMAAFILKPMNKPTDRRCSFENCNAFHKGKGYCRYHYDQTLRGKSLTNRRIAKTKCDFQDCKKKHIAKGFCGTHYKQMQRGQVLKAVKYYKKDNRCEIKNCYNPSRIKGYCLNHSYKLKRYGDPMHPGTRNVVHNVECKAIGCKNQYLAKGYCKLHYDRRRESITNKKAP